VRDGNWTTHRGSPLLYPIDYVEAIRRGHMLGPAYTA